MEDAQTPVEAIVRRPRPFLTRFKLKAGFESPLVMDARHIAMMPNMASPWTDRGWLHGAPLFTFAGMSFIFNPMTVIAFFTLPAPLRGDAAALQNLARNTGAGLPVVNDHPMSAVVPTVSTVVPTTV